MKKYLPTYPDCFVCGKDNNIGLKRRFTVECAPKQGLNDFEVVTEITFTKEYVGFNGIVHGGVVTALIDETMWWAAAVKTSLSFVTAELNVKFIKPVRVDERLTFKGKIVENKKKMTVNEGVVIDSKGDVLVRAMGKFFAMSEEESKKVIEHLAFEKDTYSVPKRD